MVPYRFARPWLLIDWIYQLTEAGRSEKRQQKALFDFCFKKMKEKREALRKNAAASVADDEITGAISRKTSLLEYMVEVNERNPCFSEQDIIEECCTFMLAGQDSVGTATAMTLFLLANNPKWQERCINELNRIFGDDKRPATMADLREMKCLDMCIKESLRLYPSVPLFARTLEQDVTIGEDLKGECDRERFLPGIAHTKLTVNIIVNLLACCDREACGTGRLRRVYSAV